MGTFIFISLAIGEIALWVTIAIVSHLPGGAPAHPQAAMIVILLLFLSLAAHLLAFGGALYAFATQGRGRSLSRIV